MSYKRSIKTYPKSVQGVKKVLNLHEKVLGLRKIDMITLKHKNVEYFYYKTNCIILILMFILRLMQCK